MKLSLGSATAGDGLSVLGPGLAPRALPGAKDALLSKPTGFKYRARGSAAVSLST